MTILRLLLFIALQLSFALGCLFVIADTNAFSNVWLNHTILISPTFFTLLSIKAWHQSFVWRRMIAMRSFDIRQSRTGEPNNRWQVSASPLESLSFLCTAFGIYSLLVQFSVANAGFIVIGIVAFKAFLSSLLRRKAI